MIYIDWEEEKEWGEGEKKGLKVKLELGEGVGEADMVVECEIANEIYEIFELIVGGNEERAKYARAKEGQKGGEGWLMEMKEGDYIRILGKKEGKRALCNGHSSGSSSSVPPPTTFRKRNDSGWFYGENLVTKSKGFVLSFFIDSIAFIFLFCFNRYFPVGFARFFSNQVTSIPDSAIKKQQALNERLDQQQQQKSKKSGKKSKSKEAMGEGGLEGAVKGGDFSLSDCLIIQGPQHVPLLNFEEGGGKGWSGVVAKHIFVRLYQLCGKYPLSSCHPLLLKKENYHKALFPEGDEEGGGKVGELVSEKEEEKASLIQEIVCLVSSFLICFYFIILSFCLFYLF